MSPPRLGWLWLALACSLACAHSPKGHPISALVLSDPFEQLEGVRAEHLDLVRPYQFREKSLDRIEIAFGPPPDEPGARLVLARALIDAMLYGELAQSAPVLDALSDKDFWDKAEALLGAEAQEPLEAAMADGRALIEALRGRAMDLSYHQTLTRLSSPSNVWSTEARTARLLDLDEVIEALAELGVEERGRLFVGALGPWLCEAPEALAAQDAPGPLWSAGLTRACSPVCKAGQEASEGVSLPGKGAVEVAACGYEAVGWPGDADERLWSPEVGVMSRALASVFPTLRGLLSGRHPLVLSVEPELEALGNRMLSRPLVIPWPLEGPQSPWLVLPTLRGAGQAAWDEGLTYAALVDGALRVGTLPMLSADPEGVRFHDGRAGQGIPGRAVVYAESLGRLDPEVADIARRVFAQTRARTMARASALGVEPGSGLAVLIDAWEPLDRALPALEVVRRGAGGGLVARFVVWSAEASAPRALRLRLSEGGRRAGGGVLDGFPEEVRPLDLKLVVGGVGVSVVLGDKSAGEVGLGPEGGLDMAALTRALVSLRKARPTLGEATIEAGEGSGKVAFGVLIEVVDAALGAGLEDLALVTSPRSP